MGCHSLFESVNRGLMPTAALRQFPHDWMPYACKCFLTLHFTVSCIHVQQLTPLCFRNCGRSGCPARQKNLRDLKRSYDLHVFKLIAERPLVWLCYTSPAKDSREGVLHSLHFRFPSSSVPQVVSRLLSCSRCFKFESYARDIYCSELTPPAAQRKEHNSVQYSLSGCLRIRSSRPRHRPAPGR